MTASTQKKHRRPRGSGSVFKIGRVYWISYYNAAGQRVKESSGSPLKGVAEGLLQKRNGAVEHHLPVVKNAERLTFNTAAQAVIDDAVANGKRSLTVITRRINKHLIPYFGGRRLAAITTADVVAFVAHRQEQGIIAHKGPRKGKRVANVSNAEINRESQLLKRIFNLAIEHGKIAQKPNITMLRESAARSGFFEADQIASVLAHLPADLRPPITFAYLTGWRLASEVLPLEWRNVDLQAGEVRLDAGTTKNGEGRVIYVSEALRQVLKEQQQAHKALKDKGIITPLVFWRMVADTRGGEKKPQPIISLLKAWRKACKDAGLPGRIPHDLRRTAIRNMVRAGIGQKVAMLMSGHQTPSVFERYDIVDAGDLKEAAQKMNRAANGG